MLPNDLIGPGLTIDYANSSDFLDRNRSAYPFLDPDFILQICYEHPTRFNELLPGFDVNLHNARRIGKTTGWIRENVRYDNSEELDFWFEHFDSLASHANPQYEIYVSMIKNGTWPFPPVVISAAVAANLGAPPFIGRPYHLIEGTHRISYLLRMLQKGMISELGVHDLIAVEPNGRL